MYIYKISGNVTDPVDLIKVIASCILRAHKMLLKYRVRQKELPYLRSE